jgi:hydroxymethylpyrimidine pyrophosphatase-like HAD family hydrolase
VTRPLLLALDVDGTIVDWDGNLSPAIRSAVLDLAAREDVHLVLASGRSLVAMLPVFAQLGVSEGYAVCSNGAVTVRVSPPTGPDVGSPMPAYDLIDEVTFDASEVVALLHEHLPSAHFAVEVLGVGFRVHGDFPEEELSGEIEHVAFADLTAAPVTRVVVRSPDQTPQDFLDVISRIGLHGVSYSVGWTAWLDLAPEGVTKASALEQVRRRLGVEPGATFAAGDGRNDVEMLRWAAHGAAMGNAPAEVQAVADEVLPDVREDGLLHLLKRL